MERERGLDGCVCVYLCMRVCVYVCLVWRDNDVSGTRGAVEGVVEV